MKYTQKINSIEHSKRILAHFDDETIRVYQAYNNQIADEAIKLGTFGSCFKMDRMTWIKCSFLWMMYRSCWATKEGQERILAIDITRDGFNTILQNAVLSSFDKEIYNNYDDWKAILGNSQVRCQWDPDRDIYGNALDNRAIQLGLKGSIVDKYVNEWIVKISDITDTVINIRESIRSKTFNDSMLPVETKYILNEREMRVLDVKR